MEHHLCTRWPHRRTARTIQRPSVVSTHQQRTRRFRIWTPNGTGSRVASIIIQSIVAIAAEEKVVRAANEHQTRRFNEGTVAGVAVENLGRSTGGSHTVGFDGLQHDGRGVRSVAVAAGAAATEAVAVDFIDDVEGAVGVCEAGRIDGAALTVVRD